MSNKWHRGVVQKDAYLAVCILLVAESVLDLGLAPICRTGEEVVAHGNGNIATDIDLVIVEDHVRPSLATIDRKASIFSMTILNCAVPNKVGHRISSGRPKLCFSCLGWFEEHICVAIAIQLTSSFGSSCNIVPTIKIGLGDLLDGSGPCCLCQLDQNKCANTHSTFSQQN